jgi:uncharacterized protein (DUF2141 family)
MACWRVFSTRSTVLALVCGGVWPASGAAAGGEPTTATLTIDVGGLRSAEGRVLIALYRGADGFPGEHGKAFRSAAATIVGDRARVELSGLPPGEYAFALVHDENGNDRLDKSWLGIPKEGFGASNDARGRFGPPKYADAKFTVAAGGAAQRVRVTYM